MWWTPRAIGLHVALVLALPTFAILGDWQYHRAIAGNTLSWAYTFEWPFFACYAIWMWWRIIHDQDLDAEGLEAQPQPERGPGETKHKREFRPGPSCRNSFDPFDESDPELAAYNRYLAQLNEADEPSADHAR